MFMHKCLVALSTSVHIRPETEPRPRGARRCIRRAWHRCGWALGGLLDHLNCLVDSCARDCCCPRGVAMHAPELSNQGDMDHSVTVLLVAEHCADEVWTIQRLRGADRQPQTPKQGSHPLTESSVGNPQLFSQGTLGDETQGHRIPVRQAITRELLQAVRNRVPGI